MATDKQIEYAEILLNEAGVDSSTARKAWIKARFYPKQFLSDLTTKEASQLITELKERT